MPGSKNPIKPEDNINIKAGQQSEVIIKLLRPKDLLSLELRFTNFTINLKENQLTLTDKASSGLMMVIFQPQSIAEECGTEEESGIVPPGKPAKMLISGESRLVFRIKKNLRLTEEDLLDWENFDLIVNERARGAAIGPNYYSPPSQRSDIIDNLIETKGLKAFQFSNIRGMSKIEKKYLKNLCFPYETVQGQTNVTGPGKIPDPISLSKDPVYPPGEWQTSLEIPRQLYLSPTKYAGWKQRIELKSYDGVLNKEKKQLYELWHSRMGTKAFQGKIFIGIDDSDFSFEERMLRILWGENIHQDYKNDKFPESNDFLKNTSLCDEDRHFLVHESSNFDINNFTPQPVRAKILFLTSLGAYLNSTFLVDRSNLDKAPPLKITKWKHLQTLAREHYVEIVEAGFIMPFGHKASKFTITERKPDIVNGTSSNFQRELIVITEPVKYYNYREYNQNQPSENLFLNFCFSKVEMITTVSPLLDTEKRKLRIDNNTQSIEPELLGNSNSPKPPNDEDQFVIRSNNKDVNFKIQTEDLNGNIVNFSLPLVFVSSNIIADKAGELVGAYNEGILVNKHNEILKDDNQNIILKKNDNLNGQKCSLAPFEKNGCDTAFATYNIAYGTIFLNDCIPDESQNFLPVIDTIEIIEPSYQRLTGSSQTITVCLVDDSNQGHVFAMVKDQIKPKFNFGANDNGDKTGGFVIPNFTLTGLSKATGAFGGNIEKFKNASAEAFDFFSGEIDMPDPLLFGVFKLSEILDFPNNITNIINNTNNAYDLGESLENKLKGVNNSFPKIPNLRTEETEDEIITYYAVKADLKKEEYSIESIVKLTALETDCKNFLSIETSTRLKKNPHGIPSFSTIASLKPFTISLLDGMININFKLVEFKSEADKSPDISIELKEGSGKESGLTFGGPLRFVQNIIDKIPHNGFSDPPIFDVTKQGVKCGYSLSLPDISLGAFMLGNLSVAAEVNLPFTGAPLTMSFRFCEKQQPFALIISLFGGGGYFGLEVDLQGLRQIDAALEFCAGCDLNLGVASGSVNIVGGIYYKMESVNDHSSTKLNGYLRINGAMSIIGLITASIELYLALSWVESTNKVFGEASINIKVELLFFSKTVSVHTSRTFSGSGSDPNFRQTYSEEKWQEFCEAFAV